MSVQPFQKIGCFVAYRIDPAHIAGLEFGGAGGSAPIEGNQRVKLANPEKSSQYASVAYFGVG